MTTDDQNPTPSQVRGAIQAGETGDIREGFDPAAAPMETDGEAAGTPMTGEAARIALETQRSPVREAQGGTDTAMRAPASMEPQPQGGLHPGFTVRIVGLCILGAAVLVTMVLMLD